MITEHLTDCWRVSDCDLGGMIVLATLGQAQLGSLLRDKEPIDLDLTFRARRMTASRLSDASGIPLQTVRRKLALLKEKGWVTEDKGASRSLAIADGCAPVREALDGLYMRGFARAKRLAAALWPYV